MCIASQKIPYTLWPDHLFHLFHEIINYVNNKELIFIITLFIKVQKLGITSISKNNVNMFFKKIFRYSNDYMPLYKQKVTNAI